MARLSPGRLESREADRVLQPRLIAWAGALGHHVLLDRYRDGVDTIGLRADDEPELGRDPVVATLSLGATRRFVLKPRRARPGPGCSLDVEPGSLLMMGGTCQRHCVHGVPPGRRHGRADQPDLPPVAPRAVR